MEYHCPLPDVLITEILLRVPVKSLLRFKCVGKNWYSLISSSFFIKQHYHHKNNPSRLLIHFPDYKSSKTSTSVLLPEKILPGVTPLHEKPSYLQIPARLHEIIGTLDGIFLLYRKVHFDRNRLALWNPAIRELRLLPPIHFKHDPNLYHHGDVFGFGFDALSQDYKVIYLRYFYDEETRSVDPPVYAYVYSLGNDCWRNITCKFNAARTDIENSDCSTCVNGIYYWSALNYVEVLPRTFPRTINCHLLIPFFDMHNEVFGEIPGPDIEGLVNGYLTLYDESICLLVRRENDSVYSVDIWLMSENSFWNKILTVVPTIQDYYRPIGLWEHDKLILKCGEECTEMVLYDCKTHEVTHLVDMKEGRGYKQSFGYKESLVSIKSNNGSCEQGDVLDLIGDYFKHRVTAISCSR